MLFDGMNVTFTWIKECSNPFAWQMTMRAGAARGMAHLGVFKALEDNGICVDMMAGTSAGAMTGTIYAAGFEPTFATTSFKNDLLPHWIFRRLPASGYWYLLYKYRMNRFEPMLRKYLKHARMEQLYIPMTTVAVDLVEGIPLYRLHGDAVVNILESINLPPLSLPRFDGDQALVDGGLLNNVPADMLLSQGCNFVIASTVTAKIERISWESDLSVALSAAAYFPQSKLLCAKT